MMATDSRPSATASMRQVEVGHPSATISTSSLDSFHTARFVRPTPLFRDAFPEFHGRSLVEQAHAQGLATPVLDRPLPTAGVSRSLLEARIFLVGQQLGAMDGELLLSQAEARRGVRQIGEEELQEAQVAQFRRLGVWPVEPSL